jgi:hypothetical protein
MDLSDTDLRAIDEYEEVDQHRYRRVSVEVEVWGCGPGTTVMPAQTYVAGPALVSSSDSTPPTA